MLRIFRIVCYIIAFSWVVLSKKYSDASFHLTRGKFGDEFSNILGGNGSYVSASCKRHNAACRTSRCEYCVCNKNVTTYFRNSNNTRGQCTRDFVIAKESGK